MENEDINTLTGEEKELGELPMEPNWEIGPDGNPIDVGFLKEWMEKEKRRTGQYPDIELPWKMPPPLDSEEEESGDFGDSEEDIE